MKLIKLLLIFILFFAPTLSFAKNKQFYFGPEIVTLTGITKILTFPGQPNYESIKHGDAEEVGAYLLLNNPIDVTVTPRFKNNNDSEKNTKIIQLAIHQDKDWAKMKEGNYIIVEGTLFHALFGHHHTRILLSVKKVIVLSQSKNVGNKLHITNEDCKFMQYQNLQTPGIEC